VGVSAAATATFNEAVQAITFTLTSSSGASVAGTLSYNSSTNTETFTPAAPLAYGTTYTATVSGAKDADGDAMSGSTSWSFTTDPLQPAVTSHAPTSNATGMAVSAIPTVSFNEAVQGVTFTLTSSTGSSVTGTLAFNSSTNTETFTPTAPLASGATYTATVSGAKDADGDAMSGSTSWSFTTMASTSGTTATFIAQDKTTQGTWIGTYGSQGYDVIGGASSLPSYATITPSGQNANTWASGTTDPRALQNPGGSGRIAACWYAPHSFTVDVDLTDGQAHNLELYFIDWDSSTRAEQIQISNASTGTVLSTQTITSFNSGVYLDWTVSGNLLITINNTSATGANAVLSGLFLDPSPTSPPTVTAGSPGASTTNVAVSSSVSASFDEQVQSSTISLSLTPVGGSPVAASIIYYSSTKTATLIPSSALAYSTRYIASVSGAVNNNGIAMAAPFSWSFTTAPDWPTVTGETPAPATLGVALASPLTATFNQAVQASTIIFTLTNDFGNSVAGTVSYSSATDTATFTPSTPLRASTTYTATVSGAISSTGYAMTAPVTWEFITDAGPATVTAETPTAAATGLGSATRVTATFSEPVQAGTINFTLTGSGGSSIAAAVSYNPATQTATLTPSSPLTASTTYTATVSGAQDLAGDPMTAPVTWSFTTATAASTLQNGLVAEWSFNEGSGTTTADVTGNGHTGTLSGGVSWTTGLVGPYALTFNGASAGQVTVPDSPSLEFSATQSYSVTAWVYVPSLPNTEVGIVTKFNLAGDWYGIWINSYNQWMGSAGNYAPNLNGPTVSTGWSQVSLVQNGSAGTLSLFVNGVRVASGPAEPSNGTGPLNIGGDNQAGGNFTGTIDDVRIYGRALSGGEIEGLFNSAPPTVSAESPTSAATGTPTAPTVTATFTEPVQASTISFTLKTSTGVSVPGTVTYNSAAGIASFTPSTVLAYATTYTASVTGAENAYGTAMPTPISWSFTTAAAPAFAPNASTGEYIITDDNTIPNYGYDPTVVSIANGSWSSASTWSIGQVPGAGAIVSIAAGTTVTYDADSTAVLSAITIQPGGTLQFATNINTEVIAADYLVLPGGTLNVGTQANPIAPNVTTLIETANQTINTTFDPSQYGDSLIGLGNITIYGAYKTPFVQVAVAPQAGDTALYFEQPVTGWQVGDELYLPDTRQLDGNDDPQSGNFVSEQETAYIASISANGLVVTLTSPLQYGHSGATDSNGNVTFLPDVVDETRNVVIRSQSGGANRGFVLFTQRANVNINSADFLALGRTTNATINDTTYNSSGQVTSIGTNQQDRSPVVFLDLWGPATPQTDGYQYTFADNTVLCPMTPQTHIWAIELNNSSYGLIQGNFVDNWYGAGISLVTGAEVDNMIEGNFVTAIGGTGNRDTTGLDGTGYWSPTVDDSWVDNVATDINPGGVYSYGFTIDQEYVGGQGIVRVVAYQGADPTQAGQSIMVNMYGASLVQFAGNETYGATPDGFNFWAVGTFGEVNYGSAGVVQNFYTWNLSQWGYFGYESNNLTINGFIDRGNASLAEGLGLWFADYQQQGLIVNNADVQGVLTGMDAPESGVGESLFENSYFSDVVDVAVASPGNVSEPSAEVPQSIVLDNDLYAAPSGSPVNAVDMEYTTGGGFSGNLQINLTTLQQIFVYDYDQVSGDNFQVYYTQQTASFIVPKSGSAYGLVASPASGLTNQQNWTTYGVAIAGALAPSTATAMAGIDGLVVPLSSGVSKAVLVPSAPAGGPAPSAGIAPTSAAQPLSSENAMAPVSGQDDPTATVPGLMSAPTAIGSTTVLNDVRRPLVISLPAANSSTSVARTSRSKVARVVAGPLGLAGSGRSRAQQVSIDHSRSSSKTGSV
jgi:hypothetical protein